MTKAALFTSIGIETSAKCNRKCSFCPNVGTDRPDDYMPVELFHKIIADLKSINYKKRVELYIYNEPTRDKRLHDFIKHVRAELPRACIMINTNGDYFQSREDIISYFNAGLNQMQINIYSHAKREEQMRAWVDSIPWLDQEGSLYQYTSPSNQRCQVVAKYQLEAGWKDGIHHLSNRSGNIPNFKPPLAEPLQKACTKPFRFLNINWKGDAILCCNDYHGTTSMGNVRDRTVEDLWNDEKFNIYRVKLQNKDRRISLCDVCDFDGGPYQHMIKKVSFGDERDAEIVAADLRGGLNRDGMVSLTVKGK